MVETCVVCGVGIASADPVMLNCISGKPTNDPKERIVKACGQVCAKLVEKARLCANVAPAIKSAFDNAVLRNVITWRTYFEALAEAYDTPPADLAQADDVLNAELGRARCPEDDAVLNAALAIAPKNMVPNLVKLAREEKAKKAINKRLNDAHSNIRALSAKPFEAHLGGLSAWAEPLAIDTVPNVSVLKVDVPDGTKRPTRTPMFPKLPQKKMLPRTRYETIGDSFRDSILVRAHGPGNVMRELEVEGRFWAMHGRNSQHIVPEGERCANDDDLETLLCAMPELVKTYIAGKVEEPNLGSIQDKLTRQLFMTDPEIRAYVAKQVELRHAVVTDGFIADRKEREGMARAWDRAMSLHEPEREWMRRCHSRACAMMNHDPDLR